MSRRRSGTNWSQIRSLIESSLRQQPGFQESFRLKEKISTLGEGLFHKNYAFEVGDKQLVLRLANVEDGLQSRKEAVAAENRPGGHGPEHYLDLLGSIFRRVRN